jgi:hypothetical protein
VGEAINATSIDPSGIDLSGPGTNTFAPGGGMQDVVQLVNDAVNSLWVVDGLSNAVLELSGGSSSTYDLTINSGAELDLDTGAIVKVDPNTNGILVTNDQSILQVQGGFEPAVLTSNGDGSWGGLTESNAPFVGEPADTLITYGSTSLSLVWNASISDAVLANADTAIHIQNAWSLQVSNTDIYNTSSAFDVDTTLLGLVDCAPQYLSNISLDGVFFGSIGVPGISFNPLDYVLSIASDLADYAGYEESASILDNTDTILGFIGTPDIGIADNTIPSAVYKCTIPIVPEVGIILPEFPISVYIPPTTEPYPER